MRHLIDLVRKLFAIFWPSIDLTSRSSNRSIGVEFIHAPGRSLSVSFVDCLCPLVNCRSNPTPVDCPIVTLGGTSRLNCFIESPRTSFDLADVLVVYVFIDLCVFYIPCLIFNLLSHFLLFCFVHRISIEIILHKVTTTLSFQTRWVSITQSLYLASCMSPRLPDQE